MLAAAVAVAVSTVCGTRRGISGTVRLPSAAHSAQLPGPYTLGKKVTGHTSLGTDFKILSSYLYNLQLVAGICRQMNISD